MTDLQELVTRRTRTHCKRWHDLTVEGALHSNRDCRLCAIARSAANRRGERLPPIRAVTCRNGHDLTLPGARNKWRSCQQCIDNAADLRRKKWDGRCLNGHDLDDPAVAYVNPTTGTRTCKLCRAERQRRYRTGSPDLPPPKPKAQPCLSDELRDSRLTTAILEWDDRIERETRAWVREDLREKKAEHLAEIRGERAAG